MYLKNIFDRILAFILLILFLPFLIVFSIILLFELKSFPIYLQERGLTLEKNRFWIYKLKTIKSRDRNIEHKTEEDIFLKTALQDKVKPFSKWLRKTGLDELPQLVNVMMGKMCLIGPRPLMIEDLETMKRISPEIYTRRENLKSLPGISGLWQLFGNRSEGLIGMIALETLYDKVASPLLDLKLLAYTSTVILQAKNSDSIFYVERLRPNKVHTYVDSSSNLKINLNIPDGIAKFIIENVEKHEGKYTVEIPNNWWYVSNTYKSAKKRFDQISITPQKKDSNKPV
ncbi:MAG: sugar transferase [Ignavibacteriales bacterium]|nr:sugar transferase [Ignavibacteriales bacterium]